MAHFLFLLFSVLRVYGYSYGVLIYLIGSAVWLHSSRKD